MNRIGPKLLLVVAVLVLPIKARWAQAQTETVLFSFTNTSDGANPVTGLVRDAKGNLYGTSYRGGTNGLGTVFKLDTIGKETVLHSFAGGTDGSDVESQNIWDQLARRPKLQFWLQFAWFRNTFANYFLPLAPVGLTPKMSDPAFDTELPRQCAWVPGLPWIRGRR